MLPTSGEPSRFISTQRISRSSSSFQLPSVGTSQVYDSTESNGLVPTNGSKAPRQRTSRGVAERLDAGEDVLGGLDRGVDLVGVRLGAVDDRQPLDLGREVLVDLHADRLRRVRLDLEHGLLVDVRVGVVVVAARGRDQEEHDGRDGTRRPPAADGDDGATREGRDVLPRCHGCRGSPTRTPASSGCRALAGVVSSGAPSG